MWLARLHGPDRSRSTERECLAWQARSAAHRLAFERCTDTWQDVGGISRRDVARSHERGDGGSATRRVASAAVALVCVSTLAWCWWPAGDEYRTGMGEQRVVMLSDGTRMTLNTSTELRVDLTKTQRTVKVMRGEALFEVAKDPGRPFAVRALEASVIATGTAFLVRATPETNGGDGQLDVTLIEGQVIVQGTHPPGTGTLPTQVVMSPGERLRLKIAQGRGASSAPAVRVDRPRVEHLLAWKRGELWFDDVTLGEAVAEMNRYSASPAISVDETLSETLRVSGIYRSGDNLGFARAIAQLHGLAVHEKQDRLALVPP
ncbi:FecR family protein [Roseateles sp. P5_E8]